MLCATTAERCAITPASAFAALRRTFARSGAERRTSDALPQFSHVRHDVIRNLDGSAHAIFAADGARFEDLDADGLAAQHERMCELHRTLNLQRRLTITAHLVRTEASAADLPPPTHRIPFVAALDEAYRHRLLARGHLWRNTLLLGILIRPPTLSGRTGRRVAREAQAVDRADLEALDHIAGTIAADLTRSYGLRRLGLRTADGLAYRPGMETDPGLPLFSEIAEAHALILTGRRIAVPLPQGRLARAICPHRVVIRPDRVVELHHAAGQSRAALFGLSVYPVESVAGLFDGLLAAPYRFVLSQSMGTMRLHEAQAFVTRTSNHFVSANDPAATQKAQLADAADELQQRLYGMGVHNLTLMVLADDEAALAVASAAADDDLRASGAIISRLDWDLEEAYFGQVPGAEEKHPRAAPWKTRNFAAAAPLHGFPLGWRGGKWCDVAAVLTTNGGTPYHWNPHTSEAGGPGDVPHMLITGPTGSGKTTVMLALLAWLMERAGVRVVLWDKDRGAKLFVQRMGGAYIGIRLNEDTGLAPLRALDGRDPSDLAFLARGVRALILSDGGPSLGPQDEHRLDLGLRTVMSLPPALRSLHEVRAFLGTAPDSVGARLRRWCAGEPLGWVWDNPRDRIRLDAQIVAFDQTRYLDHPDACGPIQSYLFHRTGKLVGAGAMVVAIDEFQKSLENAAFEGLIGDGLATFRKADCAMWLCTQSAATARLARSIAHTIREQCLTQMHFPNGSAQWADFGPGGLGVSEPAFGWIRHGLSGGRGRFLLKQGASCVPVQLCLDGMDDEIATLSGRTETVALMDAIEVEMPGADLEGLFAEFHRRRVLPDFGARRPVEDP